MKIVLDGIEVVPPVEAAKLLNKQRTMIYYYLDHKILESIKYNNKIWVTVESINKLLGE